MSQLSSETVLITGASSGIGLELARCFAADKSNLVLVARNRDAMETLSAELRRQHGIDVHILPADLAQPESPAKIFDEVKGRGITVDVLVNNAGFGAHGPFTELSLQWQLDMIQVNVTALAALTRLFLPEMIQRRHGGILNVGSVAGFLPGPNMAVYYATKAFVLSFSEAIAAETAGAGIIVSAFCPGPTATNFGKVARGERERKRKFSKMSAEAAAQYGYKKFRDGKVVAISGWGNQIVPYLLRTLPRNVVRKIMNHLNEQESVKKTGRQ